MLSPRILELVGQLHDEQRRRDTARELAAELDAVELLIFAPDPEIGVLLPAPGLPQTLAPGREWRALLDACLRDGHASASLTLDDRVLRASGTAAPGGSVFVLLGGEPRDDLVAALLPLAPLLSSSFARERAVIAASGHAAVARQAAGTANRLAGALDSVRRDLQGALNRAEQALRERDAFVSIAAHELNTPITILKGMAQLQQRRLNRTGSLDTEALREHLDRIAIQASKISRLIGQLLDLSRLDGGQLALEPAPTDVVALVREVIDAVVVQTQTHHFSLTGSASVVADVDALRLEQVISNVIDNAIKYSPVGSSIQVDVHAMDDTFSIGVADDGFGIPNDEREHIFERFQRLAGRTHLHGLGIGLFISRQVVELHGGEIHVESRLNQSGSRFVITIPLQWSVSV